MGTRRSHLKPLEHCLGRRRYTDPVNNSVFEDSAEAGHHTNG